MKSGVSGTDERDKGSKKIRRERGREVTKQILLKEINRKDKAEKIEKIKGGKADTDLETRGPREEKLL